MSAAMKYKHLVNEMEESEEHLEELDWQSYQEVGTLTNDEKNLMEKINETIKSEDGGRTERLEIIRSDLDSFVSIFSKLVGKVCQPNALKYVLTLLSEALRGSPEFLRLYHQKCGGAEAYSPFLRWLYNEDVFIKTCLVDVISCLWEEFQDMNEKEVERVIDEVCTILRSKNNNNANLKALKPLMRLLRDEKCRVLFHKTGCISLLPELIRHNPKSKQVKYEVAFCLWLLTFSIHQKEVNHTLMDIRIVPVIHNLLIHEKKEKVVRISLLVFHNLIRDEEHAPDYVGDMISVSVPKTLNNLLRRKFEDEDIVSVLEELSETLEQNIDKLTSFDEYRQELYSKNLEWSPAHSSDKFWRENMSQFEAENFKVVGELVDLLSDSEPQTVAVALHDLGQFVRFHPLGKKILQERFNAKVRIMELMEHSNEEVRKHALLCTQKLMIRNWTYLQK